ncbi:MAG: C1 family peptidase [Flavobacteriales bacterium]|nr:C1 family peptidase [Flavobacteriales bacterium]
MKSLFTSIVLCVALFANAQEKPKTDLAYKFTPVKENGAGVTEDQCATGTCWSFATISFLESEIIRKGNKPVDLSEMFNVRVNYSKKADSYVRFQGKQQFGPGGLSHDVMGVVAEYGIVPESAFPGVMDAKNEYNHGGLDAMLESTVKTVLEKKLNEENNEWKQTIDGMLDAGVGKIPGTFEYDGKKYTAQSFRDAMKINANDYVSITSFSHHPFYSQFVLEVPDNWMKGSFYNVPLEDLQKIADYAIDNGYTIAWDADVSEKGFSFSNGMAILPDPSVKKEEMWSTVVKEADVTQQSRQDGFDTFRTTDDHLMHITGKAKDQNGNIYYITKNSWGQQNPFGGYQYVSKNYFQMKTIGIMIHKDALPKEIKVKLGII